MNIRFHYHESFQWMEKEVRKYEDFDVKMQCWEDMAVLMASMCFTIFNCLPLPFFFTFFFMKSQFDCFALSLEAFKKFTPEGCVLVQQYLFCFSSVIILWSITLHFFTQVWAESYNNHPVCVCCVCVCVWHHLISDYKILISMWALEQDVKRTEVQIFWYLM